MYSLRKNDQLNLDTSCFREYVFRNNKNFIPNLKTASTKSSIATY